MEKNQSKYSSTSKDSFVSKALHGLKEVIRGDIHSMNEITHELDRAENENMNIIDLIENHHDYLKESIEVLLDKKSEIGDKQLHLERFLQLLYMHGKSEEETLYRSLLHSSERQARIEGFGGQEEHEIAYRLADELRDLHFESRWTEEIDAKVSVLAALVESHLKEEESELFSIAKKNISGAEFEDLGHAYIEKCKTYLLYPKTFI